MSLLGITSNGFTKILLYLFGNEMGSLIFFISIAIRFEPKIAFSQQFIIGK